jgi:acetyl-CoA/propionyl-CoA carboxylase, biotin carboxylase, biotin carboxyl carrier protein
MLAKVIAHGADRGQALDRLTAALDATTVLGLVTNLRFLRWLVREPAVRDGQMRIDSLDRLWPPDDWTERTAIPDAIWRQAAGELLDLGSETASDDDGDWGGGWRLNGPARVRLVADAGEAAERTVAPTRVGVESSDPLVAAARRTDPDGAPVVDLDLAGRSVAFRFAPPPDVDRAARAASSHQAGGAAEIVAPMPGAIIAVHRRSGETVGAGDPLVTLEAMKMEHVVAAPVGGVVGDLDARIGQQVTRGQRLAIVEPPR